MVSNLTRNQAPACRLRVRAPCPPLYFCKVLKLDERPPREARRAFLSYVDLYCLNAPVAVFTQKSVIYGRRFDRVVPRIKTRTGSVSVKRTRDSRTILRKSGVGILFASAS